MIADRLTLFACLCAATLACEKDRSRASASGANPSALAPSAVPPPSRTTLTKTVGEKTVDVLENGTKRETFRVDAKNFEKDSTGPDRFFGYPILKRGRELTAAEQRELSALLLRDSSYLDIEKYACNNSEAYGLRITHGSEVVELLFTFPCERVSFLKRANGDPQLTPGEYIDPIGSRVLAMLRACVP